MAKVPVVRKVAVKKKIMGGYHVVFHCPNCQGQLKSNEDDIGQPDQCPECNGHFFLHQDIEKIIEAKEREAGLEKQQKLEEKKIEEERLKKQKEEILFRKEKSKKSQQIKNEIKKQSKTIKKQEQIRIQQHNRSAIEGIEELQKDPVKILNIYYQLCNGVALLLFIMFGVLMGIFLIDFWFYSESEWAVLSAIIVPSISVFIAGFALLVIGGLVKCQYLMEKNSRMALIELKQLKFHTLRSQESAGWAGGWDNEMVDDESMFVDDEDDDDDEDEDEDEDDGWNEME